MRKLFFIFLVFGTQKLSDQFSWSYSQMSCHYGERGSLTVHCKNATSGYFKMTPYRFDHLDETLVCLNCNLSSLDSGTFDISGNQIKTLDITNSSITKIWPKAFIGLIFMEKLLLANNPISVIYPGAFIGIRKVKYIDLENSVPSLLPGVFQELHLLEVLNLRRNKLTTLEPNVFEGLSSLRILNLEYNNIRVLNEQSFSPLVSLRALILQGNLISAIKGNEFRNLTHLYQLILSNNGLANFSMNLDINNELRELNLAKNLLTTDGIKSGTFQNLNSLEDLDLGNNLLTEIPPKYFQGLFKLRNLNLFRNKIKTFSTGSFSGLPYLRVLNLSSNYLETARVSGHLLLHSLHILDLSNNIIKEFDYILFVATMPRITSINLLNNQLPCEVQSEIETLFSADGVTFVISNNKDDVPCNKPPQTAKEVLQKIINEKYKNENTNSLAAIWIILICIVIILVAILFFIQFVILHQRPIGNFHIRIVSGPSSSS